MEGKKNYVQEIFRNLPKTDCGACGLPACAQYAKALLQGKKKTSDCPYLSDEQTQGIILTLDEYFNV